MYGIASIGRHTDFGMEWWFSTRGERDRKMKVMTTNCGSRKYTAIER